MAPGGAGGATGASVSGSAPSVETRCVVFSSLTPHSTGRNVTEDVRKAYILQYAPDGAVTLQGDPERGAPTGTVEQRDRRRQFPVLVDGQRIPAP